MDWIWQLSVFLICFEIFIMKKGARVWEDWEPRVWKSPHYISLRANQASLCLGCVPRTHVLTALPVTDLSCFTPYPRQGDRLPAPLPTYHQSRRIIQDRQHCVERCLDKHSLFWEDLGTSSLLCPVGRLSGWKDPEGFLLPASCSGTSNRLRMAEAEGLACSLLPQCQRSEDQRPAHIMRTLRRATPRPGCPGAHPPSTIAVWLLAKYSATPCLCSSIYKMGMIMAPAL